MGAGDLPRDLYPNGRMTVIVHVLSKFGSKCCARHHQSLSVRYKTKWKLSIATANFSLSLNIDKGGTLFTIIPFIYSLSSRRCLS